MKLGDVVLYRLTGLEADQINRRRTSCSSIRERIVTDDWPLGAQAHIGHTAHGGDEYPMIVTRLCDPVGSGCVNGQVFLDGTDTLWVRGAYPSLVGTSGTYQPPAGGLGSE